MASISVDEPIIENYVCRISVFGAAKVGKTKIVDRLTHKKYTEQYIPTVEDFYQTVEETSGANLTLEIVDTSGTEQFPEMRKLNIQRSKLLLLVYDTTNSSSFSEVKRLYHIARRISKRSVIVIVGGKADFLPDGEIPEDIDTHIKTAQLFTDSQPDTRVHHCLCSAKKGNGIDDTMSIGLISAFPNLSQRSCESIWQRVLHKHDANHADHDPHSRHGIRCMFKRIFKKRFPNYKQ